MDGEKAAFELAARTGQAQLFSQGMVTLPMEIADALVDYISELVEKLYEQEESNNEED